MIRVKELNEASVTIQWTAFGTSGSYEILWSDKNLPTSQFLPVGQVVGTTSFTLAKATNVPHYLKVVAGTETSAVFETPIGWQPEVQLEKLDRGLIAVPVKEGIFLTWRFLKNEVAGFNERQLTGADFTVYRNDEAIANVTDSTNFLDAKGTAADAYSVAPTNGTPCASVTPWADSYLELPLQKPADGVTPVGDAYTYHANDLSVMDVDGDGAYEFILKWDPSNSHDVSQRGYTGNTYLDCYRLDGRLLWRIDCGVNIRSGAHYTQFMCYDFDGDGRGEIAFKTAPGTKIQWFDADGQVTKESYITLPAEDIASGVTHTDNYVCSPADYRQHLVALFMDWQRQPEVIAHHWPQTLEECFAIPVRYDYPLSHEDAETLVTYFIEEYALQRSSKNLLDEFAGFIYQGPEYLTIFAGDGHELETIPFPFERGDDGLMWGDYAWNRIEPCNRVDRFLAGVGYLDGVHPSLVICRGYYTRACVAAYRFDGQNLQEEWRADSGHVPMDNPFNNQLHVQEGTDPIYGGLAAQGDHSLYFADVDQDGKMEIIYGGATIDHDGSLLYSSYDYLPDGTLAKFGHGDAMHVADIDPDRPGLEIFNVFEEASHAPYGYALRRAEDGTAIFGEHEAVRDLGRCMVGDILDGRGYSCWVNTIGTFDCHGNLVQKETLGTNMPIRFTPDFTTQIIDGVDYLANNGSGVVNDYRHGVVLQPQGTAVNNGTKGNPCLVADLFGDYREELVLRTADDAALRIYTNTEVSQHKLMTLMHDPQYRCGVAWQNNCYNQPCYPSFYYASDMEMSEVLPALKRKPQIFIAGDSTAQSYRSEERPQFGWGEKLLAALAPDYFIAAEHTAESSSFTNQFTTVVNFAKAGRSTKTFLAEERLAKIAEKITAGDTLLIQFGHNDVNREKPERYVPLADFPTALGKFVAVAQENEATPLLLAPISLAATKDETLKALDEELGAYTQVMAQYAADQDIPFINLRQISSDYFSQLSSAEVDSYYLADHVHLNEKGAMQYAQWLAAALKKA